MHAQATTENHTSLDIASRSLVNRFHISDILHLFHWQNGDYYLRWFRVDEGAESKTGTKPLGETANQRRIMMNRGRCSLSKLKKTRRTCRRVLRPRARVLRSARGNKREAYAHSSSIAFSKNFPSVIATFRLCSCGRSRIKAAIQRKFSLRKRPDIDALKDGARRPVRLKNRSGDTFDEVVFEAIQDLRKAKMPRKIE